MGPVPRKQALRMTAWPPDTFATTFRRPGQHTGLDQVSLDILMDGNLDEKSLFLAAIDTAT